MASSSPARRSSTSKSRTPPKRSGAALDICGHREVDEDERPIGASGHRATNVVGSDDGRLGSGGGDRDVGPRESVLELVQTVGASATAICDVHGAASCAVRNGDLSYSTPGESFERLQSDASRPDHEHVLIAQIPEYAFGQSQRHRARRRRIRPDRSLRARSPSRGDGGAEEKRETRPNRPGSLSGLEGVAHLAENLGFPEHERVEPGGDTAEMARDIVAGVDVEVIDQQTALDVVRARECVDQLVARVVDARRERRVQLDPVARLEGRVLDDSRATLGTESESADPLP